MMMDVLTTAAEDAAPWLGGGSLIGGGIVAGLRWLGAILKDAAAEASKPIVDAMERLEKRLETHSQALAAHDSKATMILERQERLLEAQEAAQ
jgi:hypothetical protein